MPKHDTKAEYWQAKFEGQNERCIGLKATNDALEISINNHKLLTKAMEIEVVHARNTIKQLRSSLEVIRRSNACLRQQGLP